MSRSSVTFWGHVRWEDGTAHGCAIASPTFRSDLELRTWTTEMRMKFSDRGGFALSAYRRVISIDAKGEPIEGFPDDTSLATMEDMPTRERHMGFVAELVVILKDSNKPLTRGRSLREAAVASGESGSETE